MSPLNVAVIVGSTRPNRFGEFPAAWIAELAKKKGMEVEVLDLREYPLPFYQEPITASQLAPGNYTTPVAEQWAQKIADTDAFIIVAPEYNHGYSAVLKNALDYAYAQWNNKAVGFVGYGSVGGARSVEQLRLAVAELQMASVRTAVHIMAPWTLMEDGKLKGGALDPYVPSAEAMLEQIGRWGRALKVAHGTK